MSHIYSVSHVALSGRWTLGKRLSGENCRLDHPIAGCMKVAIVTNVELRIKAKPTLPMATMIESTTWAAERFAPSYVYFRSRVGDKLPHPCCLAFPTVEWCRSNGIQRIIVAQLERCLFSSRVSKGSTRSRLPDNGVCYA